MILFIAGHVEFLLNLVVIWLEVSLRFFLVSPLSTNVYLNGLNTTRTIKISLK